MRKRVLVTGGAGFLGSHLCAKLLREYCDVLCVDNYGSRSRIEFRPLPADNPHQRCPDITHARRLPHGTPKVSLEDGLAKTAAYFEGRTDADRLAWRAAS